jgi:hypothetical protein
VVIYEVKRECSRGEESMNSTSVPMCDLFNEDVSSSDDMIINK